MNKAIVEAGWRPMVMGFKAAPALLGGVAVGDKVAFELKIHDGSGEVTAIAKRWSPADRRCGRAPGQRTRSSRHIRKD